MIKKMILLLSLGTFLFSGTIKLVQVDSQGIPSVGGELLEYNTQGTKFIHTISTDILQVKYIVSGLSLPDGEKITLDSSFIDGNSAIIPADIKFLIVTDSNYDTKNYSVSLLGELTGDDPVITIKEPVVVISDEEVTITLEDGKTLEVDIAEGAEVVKEDDGDVKITFVSEDSEKIDMVANDQILSTEFVAVDTTTGETVTTELEAPFGTKATIKENGEVEQVLEIDGKISKVTTDATGKGTVQLGTAESSSTFEILSGGTSVMSDDGDFVSVAKVGKSKVTFKASTKDNKVTATIVTPSKKYLKFHL